MWKSSGQYGRVDVYAKKQHLVLTFIVKSNIKNDKCNLKLPNLATWNSRF